MIIETVKERYKNRTGAGFKCFHWSKVVRHQSKWRARSDAPSIIDSFVSSSEATTEEEVTRPIGWDRAKTTALKGKGKEGSSSQSGSSSSMSGIISTLKKLVSLFNRAPMCKHYNKLCEVNSADMNAEELMSNQGALILIKKYLNFAHNA
jgi:hypothetical protein